MVYCDNSIVILMLFCSDSWLCHIYREEVIAVNKKDFAFRRQQMAAKQSIPQLEEELAILRKRKTALKGHGSNTTQVAEQIKAITAELRSLKKLDSAKIPASAFTVPAPRKKKPTLHTRDAQKRALQGGGFSPK